jgi:hypothetical protein
LKIQIQEKMGPEMEGGWMYVRGFSAVPSRLGPYVTCATQS